MDGEERILQVEAVLELEMKIYREGEYTLIQDVYTPHRQCIPVRQERTLERLLVKNYSKCRVAERTALEEPRGKVLQICHSDGSVKVDSAETVKDGIRVEGIIQVRILYIVSDDDMPFYSVETAVPFLMWWRPEESMIPAVPACGQIWNSFPPVWPTAAISKSRRC